MNSLLRLLLLLLTTATCYAQQLVYESIEVSFFPDNATMYGYPVANDAFMRGKATLSVNQFDQDTLAFLLHGELDIDSK